MKSIAAKYVIAQAEVNPFFAVKTGQKLADSFSLFTFKLYFYRHNSLCNRYITPNYYIPSIGMNQNCIASHSAGAFRSVRQSCTSRTLLPCRPKIAPRSATLTLTFIA